MGSIFNVLKQGSEFGLIEFSVSVTFSIVIGVICLYLYRIYFKNTFDRNESLARSFPIIAPSITAIFWAIQYSLPLSLGLLGALSFVRFRTPIKKSEDIGFILLIISCSLLSSIYRFMAAGVILSLITGLIYFKALLSTDKGLPFLNKKYLTIFISTQSDQIEKIDSEIRAALLGEIRNLKSNNLTLSDIVQNNVGFNLRYLVLAKHDSNMNIKIMALLNKLENLERVEIFHEQMT